MPTERRADAGATRPDAPESCIGCLLALLFGHEMPTHNDDEPKPLP